MLNIILFELLIDVIIAKCRICLLPCLACLLLARLHVAG